MLTERYIKIYVDGQQIDSGSLHSLFFSAEEKKERKKDKEGDKFVVINCDFILIKKIFATINAVKVAQTSLQALQGGPMHWQRAVAGES